MKIDCIAIDDEPLALEIIQDYCSRIPFLDLKATFDNAVDSIEYIRNNSPDLIFLDIQMEELTGIQLLHTLKVKPYVVFTTAYDKYAIQGFELDVVDYLLKPISFERFLKAADRVLEKIQADRLMKEKPAMEIPLQASGDTYFFIKTENRMEKVRYADVLYIEGIGDYWRIITHTRKIMTLMNYKKLEELLPQSQFMRVHKSFIIAVDKIENIERNRIRIADRLIPIGETYREQFFTLIGKKS